MAKTIGLYFPIDTMLLRSIHALLDCSDQDGNPICREWISLATTVAKGLKATLQNDGDMQLSDKGARRP